MAKIGYTRVSTHEQDLEIQQNRLEAEGCSLIRSEKVSGGSRASHEELATVLEFLRPEDELIVTRLDRFGRDTRVVLNIIHECEQKNAFVKVLDPFVSTKGDMGQIVMTILGMVAQMKRRFIKERQREGIERAKQQRKYKGGQQRIDREKVLSMKSEGKGHSSIASALGLALLGFDATGLLLQPPAVPFWLKRRYSGASNDQGLTV
ncbi:MAG: recombinase family protein [Cohaesibacter sp.]|jgi:DNA invertase Pin-like site-specific DNA recombinase|nr:recombinase family protein [Cohaesibacter sp.]